MVYSDLIKQKADEYRIDIDEPSGVGKIRVCKKMLEGLFSLLNNSHTEVFQVIKMMELELLSVKNELEDIKRSSTKNVLIEKRYIESIDGIVKQVRVAYKYATAAALRKDDQDKFQVYSDISEHLPECQDAIFTALELFDSSL